MRRSTTATLAVAAVFMSLAGAAEAAPPTLYNWTGAYVGAFAGAATGASTATTEIGCVAGGYLCDNINYIPNGALVGATGSGTAGATAFTGGGFIGRNWQNGEVVYGFEADIGAMPLTITNGGSGASINAGLVNGSDPATFSMHVTASTEWLATARARVGFVPLPGLLVYGTAGLAGTTITVSNAYADNYVYTDYSGPSGGHENASTSEFRTALVLGAGAEWAMADHWKMRAEYLHADFGTLTVAGGVSYSDLWLDVNPAISSASLSTDVVRLGVAYGF